MAAPFDIETLLIRRIRTGDADAWEELIEEYEGRLLAFAASRLGRRQTSEDVVQETFVGFLTSLPNYDERRSLESYLFSICAHKLTDHLRREGRRPPIASTSSAGASEGTWTLPGSARMASSILRSVELRQMEEQALVDVLRQEIARWRERGDWTRIRCYELIFVRGWGNKQVGETIDLTEQQVANYKFEFLTRLKKAIRKQCREAFPELFEWDDEL